MKRTIMIVAAILIVACPPLFAQRGGPDPKAHERTREEIRNTERELRQVRDELAQAREELASLRHRRNNLEKAMPKSPPRTSRRDRINFEKKTEEWRREMDSLDAKIHRQQEQISRLEARERDLERRLNRLKEEEKKNQAGPPRRR